MVILIYNIKWHAEGMDPVADCCLPTEVAIVDAPDDVVSNEYAERISCALSDTYGFNHGGFLWRVLPSAHVMPSPDRPRSARTASV